MELTQTTYTSSWVPGADGSQFPIQNLPYGIFSHARSGRSARPGVAIGDAVLDLCELSNAGLLDGLGFAAESVFSEPTLNAFMARERADWRAVRARLGSLLGAGGDGDGDGHGSVSANFAKV